MTDTVFWQGFDKENVETYDKHSTSRGKEILQLGSADVKPDELRKMYL